MLIIGYSYGIRSERRLCDEVHLNLAYRWFCRLSLEDAVPNHSTFSKNRHGRFRASGAFRLLFDDIVRRCMDDRGWSLVADNGVFQQNLPFAATRRPRLLVEKQTLMSRLHFAVPALFGRSGRSIGGTDGSHQKELLFDRHAPAYDPAQTRPCPETRLWNPFCSSTTRPGPQPEARPSHDVIRRTTGLSRPLQRRLLPMRERLLTPPAAPFRHGRRPDRPSVVASCFAQPSW